MGGNPRIQNMSGKWPETENVRKKEREREKRKGNGERGNWRERSKEPGNEK
jgi:hypothetical protein